MERLYYFVEAQWASENIAKQRLKACRFFDLNDPFELRAGVLSDRSLRTRMRREAEMLHQRWGLLCFTTNWRNPLMWSHYGDRHKGICLGFDADDGIVKIVDYSPRRLPMAACRISDSGGLLEQTRNPLLTTKFDRWHYEEERRIIEPLAAMRQEGKLFFRALDGRLKLTQVIAGPSCCLEWKLKITDEIKTLPAQPELIKARLAFKTFRVVRDKRGFDNKEAWVPRCDNCNQEQQNR